MKFAFSAIPRRAVIIGGIWSGTTSGERGAAPNCATSRDKDWQHVHEG